MENLVARQEELGKELQRIISNYKKDPQSRKTDSAYYEERLRRLDGAWSTFDTTHQELLNSKNIPSDHPYVTSQYYQGIQELYKQYRTHFLEQLRRLESTQDQATTPSVSPAVPQKGILGEALTITKAQALEGGSGTPSVEELRKLIRKQRAVADALCRLLDTIKIDDIRHPKAYYDLSFQTLTQYWAQLEEYHWSIWELTEDPSTEGYNLPLYTELEERTRQHKIFLSTRIMELQSLQLTAPTPVSHTSMIQLPKVVLPKFDGDYLKWQQFHDLFMQMVHSQPISNCQKMWYLITNVTGEAEKVIRHLPLSEDNYASAWKMLQDRYQNQRLLVASLIQKLLSQPSHTSENASAAAIKELHDTTRECLMGLENLGVSTSNWDPLLLHMLIKKLDKATHALYEQSLSNPRELQSLEELLQFLEARFQSLEALGIKGKGPNLQHPRTYSAKSLASVAARQAACVVCKGNHPLFACKRFLEFTPQRRLSTLQKHNLCVNCLKAGHTAPACSLRGCTKCNKKHNTLVHTRNSDGKDPVRTSEVTTINKGVMTRKQSASESSQLPSTVASATRKIPQGYVLLATAIVKITTDDGNSIECRALLDSGSQVNLITEGLVKKLGITTAADSMFIQGIGKGRQEVQRRVNCYMKSRLTGFSARVEAFVLPQIIPSQPAQSFDIQTWPIPGNIQLADPRFYQPSQIDLLLGAEFYHQLLSIGKIKLADNLPMLQNTVLGWIVTGRLEQTPPLTATCGICSDDEGLRESIERFWAVEEVEASSNQFTSAETKCEIHFNQHVQKFNNRFIVALPFASDPDQLGDSKETALRRFMALERRLQKQPELRQQYTEFMEEYLKLGHMEEAPAEVVESQHYYLPHHCVKKPDSSTTKLRVVFDGSAKTSTNLSLNDVLYAGPTVQDELFSILLRFRLPRYVFTADIQKMYRQVLVRPEDRRYQLIFWRSDTKHPIKTYQLSTVTYGTTPAPYLATKCLQRLAQEGSSRYPLGSRVLQRDFYVDDTMTGCDSLNEALETQRQLISLLQEGGFNLRKWCANHPRLLQDIRPEHQEVQLDFTNTTEERIKTLGLLWLPKSDQFQVRICEANQQGITKRVVASNIAQFFDPLGLIAPVIVTAKIFLQELWQLKLDWDSTLPPELQTRWLKFREGLPSLSSIQVPRHMFAGMIPRKIQLHVFSDASERAYGAAAYLRSVTPDGRIIVRLLCAKSRVAPVKTISIPRLELCAARLAAQLARRVMEDLRIPEAITYYWTDSEIVLAWINSTSSRFTPFVANRVAAIQQLSLAEQWRHVSSKENPADILSRGITADKLKTHHLWFYGPPFLHGREEIWPPAYTKNIKGNHDMERKKTALPVTTSDPSIFLYNINHGNSFRRLQRVTAYCLRFIQRAKGNRSHGKTHPHLTSQEMDDALHVIVQVMQDSEFHKEIKELHQEGEVNKSSALATLSPFLDTRGILRVGGRLKESDLPYDGKHQILLPYSHPWTKLLMTTLHKESLHVSPQTLLAITRQRFWPIKGKTIARSIVQHCVQCTRARPKMLTQMMGNLPAARVQPARPFINSGVDFWGPMWTHYKIRGKKPQKCYVAVFCCFATKAIHMEVVSDLTTEAFIGSLKRFIGRRGHCKNLYCDNATNFVGANNQLQELHQAIYSSHSRERITDSCSAKGIDFHFIPPRAPHFGGLWEAAVKSAKHLLLRNVSPANLTYEELETVIIEIEAILNSRPLTAMSATPDDLTALTPGHFLIGEPLTSQIDPQAESLKINTATRWKLVSQLKQQFWKRWSSEYLHDLQHRYKWKERCKNLEPGAIVIVQDDNLPVMKWPLGRILQTFQGEDRCVRVAEVKTASGVLRRPVHKLAPLPIEDCPTPDLPAIAHTQAEVSRTKNTTKRHTPLVNNLTTSSEEVTKKRMRINYGSAILTLLLVCLVVPIKANPVGVKRFPAQPGVHFTELGRTYLISTEWRLLVYYDLTPYWTELDILVNGTKTLRYLCDQIKQRTSCDPIIARFEHIQAEIKGDNEILTNKESASRRKRGAFNIVGKITNSLFGILDDDYAQQMAQTIDAVKENEDYLLTLLRNQTSVIDSTINIVKQDFGAINRKLQSVDQLLTQVMNRIHDTGEERYQLKMIQVFNSVSTLLTLTTINLQRVQSAIIDTITDTHHGKISVLILSPQQLTREMAVIRNLLPPSVRLPAIEGNIAQLYKLMTVGSRIADKYVIFQINLPLVGLEYYNLLQVTPIPIWNNTAFVAISTSSPYLAINDFRDQYYPLSDQELQDCEVFNNTIYLCKQIHPTYHKGAHISACEINLLNGLSHQSSCKLETIEGNPIWIQLTKSNQWIYAVKTKTTITTVCKNGTFPLRLEGSGLLSINADCIIRHELATIRGHSIYPTNTRASYTVLGDFLNITFPTRPPPSQTNDSQLQLQLKDLETLQKRIAREGIFELPRQIAKKTLHHQTISYLGLLLSFGAVVLVIWKIIHLHPCCPRKPTAQPQQQEVPESQDFTINI